MYFLLAIYNQYVSCFLLTEKLAPKKSQHAQTSNYDLELHPQGRSYGSSATVSDEHREHAV
jgi:hypothetical protein